jgi:hypothetical protein
MNAVLDPHTRNALITRIRALHQHSTDHHLRQFNV